MRAAGQRPAPVASATTSLQALNRMLAPNAERSPTGTTSSGARYQANLSGGDAPGIAPGANHSGGEAPGIAGAALQARTSQVVTLQARTSQAGDAPVIAGAALQEHVAALQGYVAALQGSKAGHSGVCPQDLSVPQLGVVIPSGHPIVGSASQGSLTSAAAVPSMVAAGEATHEARVASLESSVKMVDQMLKEYKPAEPSATQDAAQAMERCEALAAELAGYRQSRRAMEDRAKHLDKLLRHERGEREAWLVAFLTSLHTTLQELTGCIDRSISDSNQLMHTSMDGTDEVMHHLIDRVDQLLIQKESELEPLME